MLSNFVRGRMQRSKRYLRKLLSDEEYSAFQWHLVLLSAHLWHDFARIFGERGQPENAASGTPSSLRIWLWMPVSCGANT